ncbi:hypothetical protein DFJ73DRAFT_963063 [Zopfochytrium polystomum]|nr:hypothetical protein DFJ73DRAFT_963063 [Zopfochytrium polystomum]
MSAGAAMLTATATTSSSSSSSSRIIPRRPPVVVRLSHEVTIGDGGGRIATSKQWHQRGRDSTVFATFLSRSPTPTGAAATTTTASESDNGGGVDLQLLLTRDSIAGEVRLWKISPATQEEVAGGPLAVRVSREEFPDVQIATLPSNDGADLPNTVLAFGNNVQLTIAAATADHDGSVAVTDSVDVTRITNAADDPLGGVNEWRLLQSHQPPVVALAAEKDGVPQVRFYRIDETSGKIRSPSPAPFAFVPPPEPVAPNLRRQGVLFPLLITRSGGLLALDTGFPTPNSTLVLYDAAGTIVAKQPVPHTVPDCEQVTVAGDPVLLPDGSLLYATIHTTPLQGPSTLPSVLRRVDPETLAIRWETELPFRVARIAASPDAALVLAVATDRPEAAAVDADSGAVVMCDRPKHVKGARGFRGRLALAPRGTVVGVVNDDAGKGVTEVVGCRRSCGPRASPPGPGRRS